MQDRSIAIDILNGSCDKMLIKYMQDLLISVSVHLSLLQSTHLPPPSEGNRLFSHMQIPSSLKRKTGFPDIECQHYSLADQV